MASDRSDGDVQSDGDADSGGADVSALSGEEYFKASCAREMALLALMDKTGYNMVQENGQRNYGGPPPDWEGPAPPRVCEVFVCRIPQDMYEDELVPLFERAGRLYEFRLMMNFSGENRGYAFVMYTSRKEAKRAIRMLDNFEIRPRKFVRVYVSLNNCRLFLGSIPKDKSKDDILEEMNKVTEGVEDVIVYPSSTDKSRNQGFAFVEYESHKAAAMARRKLIPETFKLWGQSIRVNWAQQDVDEEVLQRVTVLYVRNLMLSTCEETLRQEFSHFRPGSVQHVKKIKDYAFVHYHCRKDAITALSLMNGVQIDGATMEVTLKKPARRKEGLSQTAPPGRSYSSSRVYLGSQNGGGGGGAYVLHSEGGGRDSRSPLWNMPLPPRLGSPYFSERSVFPLFSDTPLSPISLMSLQQSQIGSAVNLLYLHCQNKCWTDPEFQLYSTPGPDGKLLLLYKVMISSTRSTYIPDKLCVLLEEAKELAAQTALTGSLMQKEEVSPTGPLDQEETSIKEAVWTV